jgi:hypothetical protein
MAEQHPGLFPIDGHQTGIGAAYQIQIEGRILLERSYQGRVRGGGAARVLKGLLQADPTVVIVVG